MSSKAPPQSDRIAESLRLYARAQQLIPCAEMVRYAKGGGEACAVAVRIARGVTGRDRILFCAYH
jgi:glutamate-1-semialdehyde 2,1-aminomutase